MGEPGKKLYLEDLAVGQTFRSVSQPVTAADIKRFASQFDPQPFHLDEHQARQTFFQGLVASGWHTTALAMRLLVESVPFAGGIVGTAIEELRWLKPVRPDDVLRLETAILDIPAGQRSRGVVKIKSATLNQRDEPVQVLTATLLVSRRSEHPPE